MTLSQNRKLFQIAIASVTLFIVLVLAIPVALNLLSKDGKDATISGIVPPAKTALPGPIQNIKQQIINSALQNKNGDLLLFETEDFAIEYISTPNVFFVTIRDNPEKSRDLSQKWFIEKGLGQEDLCDFSVRFRYIRKPGEKASFSSLPDGCSGQPLSKP